MRIRNVINKILWKYREKLDSYYLVVIDRLNKSGLKRIPFRYVHSVDNYYVYIISNSDLMAIPIHRVLMIENVNGETIWSREKGCKEDF
uniref:UPF0248 protein ENV02_01135 n=1 Tax=Ignisphaera aggregans TaxID=334771 RepID=A0A7J3QD55_9CREN